MTVLDWAILIVILISTLISLWRGAIREVFSLATWVIAAIVGFKYNHILVPFYKGFISSEHIQLAASFLTLVIAVVVIGTLIGSNLSKIASKIGLGGLDKILGLAFGGARGILIVAIFILFAGFTELPAEPWWKNSKLVPHIQPVANSINQFISSNGYDPLGKEPGI